MMNKVTALVGVAVLAMLAGCAKQDAPPAQDDDEDVGAAPTQAQPAGPRPDTQIDRAKTAAGMMVLIDPAPQCQQYRDELEAKGATRGSVNELSEIVVQAHRAGCGKKKQQ
jgi:hypothetical protein